MSINTTPERKCPKCGQPLSKAGKVRIGKNIKQKWHCARLSGCGYATSEKIKEEN